MRLVHTEEVTGSIPVSLPQCRTMRSRLSHRGCRVASANDALAHERLVGVLELIDRWGELYHRRWGKRGHAKDGSLAARVDTFIDEVRTRTKLAHDVIAAMGEEALSAKVVEKEEGLYGGHPFTQARVAIVEAIAILTQREELTEIVGPIGPRLGPLNCIRPSGALPPSSGTTTMCVQHSRQPQRHSKGGPRDAGHSELRSPPHSAIRRGAIGEGLRSDSVTWLRSQNGQVITRDS